jgi:hypothetical protein
MAGVLGPVDDTHAARSQLFQDAVVRNCGADHTNPVSGLLYNNLQHDEVLGPLEFRLA